MKIWKHSLSRRQLMARFGHAAIVLPFMRLLEEEQLFAATSSPRAIFWYFPDGIIKPLFHPEATGSQFSFPAMTAPLERVRADVTMIKGVDYKAEGSHEGGGSYCLTGVPESQKGISIDTFLGKTFEAQSQLPVLRLGIGANFQKNSSISFFAPGVPALVEDHPVKAFYQVFGSSEAPIDPVAKERIIRGEKSILDLSLMQLRELEAQLGNLEKQKLGVHIEALRELERRVQEAGQIDVDRLPQCTATVDWRGLSFPENDSNYPSYEHRNEHFGLIGEIMSDIGLQALACGVTRVLLLQWSHPVSPTQFNFPGATGLSRGHHDTSHYGGDPASSYAREFVGCQAWFMDRLAQFIEQLKGIKVGDKSLLYHSSLLALTEIGDSNLHDFTNVGLVMAGQASGRLRTGTCLDGRGASHNQVLVSVLRAMGIEAETFGDPRRGHGPLPGLLS